MIQGHKVILRLYDGVIPVAVSGQRDATLNMEWSEQEVTTKDSEFNKEATPGEFSWSLECDRLVSEIAGADTIEAAAFSRKTLKAEMVNLATGKGYKGNIIITSISLEAPYQDVVTSSLSMIGTGPLTPMAVVVIP